MVGGEAGVGCDGFVGCFDNIELFVGCSGVVEVGWLKDTVLGTLCCSLTYPRGMMDIITKVKEQETQIEDLRASIASLKDRFIRLEMTQPRHSASHKFYLLGLIGLFLGSLALLITIIHWWLDI